MPVVQIALLIVAILAVVSALTIFWIKSRRERVQLDEGGTLCPEVKDGKSQIPEVLVILLDSSDRLGDAQSIQVRHDLERARSRLAKFGRLDVYALRDAGGVLAAPVLTICNPGDGNDLSEITANPELARKRWKEEFASRVDRVLKTGIEAVEAPTSPILEAIQAAGIQTFDLPELDSVRNRRVIVVSDLLQNVPGKMSHYEEVPEFKEFSSSAYYEEVRVPLEDVKVEVLYLARTRASGIQGLRHIEFWEAYFRSLGAELEQVTRVSGAPPVEEREGRRKG